LLSNPLIAIVTVDGRAYYALSNILKALNFPYASLLPNQKLSSNIELVVTTSKEKNKICWPNILCIEDLHSDLVISKVKILKILYPETNNLIIGIDPGKRIGLVCYFGHKKIESKVLNLIDEVAQLIIKWIKFVNVNIVIRIGDGTPHLSLKLFNLLTSDLNNNVIIELVDEYGTSHLNKHYNTEGTRDERAASLIAFKQGKLLNLT